VSVSSSESGPPTPQASGGDALAGGGRGAGPNSDEGKETLVLYSMCCIQYVL
jgi:hypothetical protein